MHTQLPESERPAALEALHGRLSQPDVLTAKFTKARFYDWVAQYQRSSRAFHAVAHLLGMTEFNPALPGKAGIYSMVTGFFHDEDYPSIGDTLLPVSAPFIRKYVEERKDKKYLKPIAADDETGQMLCRIFGFEPGQELLSFAGMNEFYSAAAAAVELESLGKDKKFVAAVIAGIEGTIAFRGPERMDKLRDRLEETNEKMKLGITPLEIDEMMIAATYTANKDVLSFLGGLEPGKDTAPTKESVLHTIYYSELLDTEEVSELRTGDKGPGYYKPADFLKARLKRTGLYQTVIPGNPDTESIDNLFYKVRLSDASGGGHYPPRNWVEEANKLAYANNYPIRIAQYARLLSAGMVYSLATLAGGDDVPMADMMNEFGARLTTQLPPNVTEARKLAYACAHDRKHGDGHDIDRSPIAELILEKLDESKIEELGKAARSYFLPEPGRPQEFLNDMGAALGGIMERVRVEMAHSANATKHKAVAIKLEAIHLPHVMAH